MRLPDPPLLLITDRKQARKPLADILGAAFAAGCRWASVREKDLPVADQIALAQSLLPLARQFGARLTLHGDTAMALRAGVDGVHLASGGDVAAAHAALRSDALIGLSVHSPADAATVSDADYIVAGPAFETASKPGYGPALSASGIAVIAKRSRVPVIAVGGIAADNLLGVIQAGAAGIAVMGGIMRAQDPSAEVDDLLKALRAQPRPR
ncbi:MAG: thiamine phosphate synthase [Pseudomonadota bacterium]